MDHSVADSALAPLRDALRLDGADLELGPIESGVAQVRLVFSESTCQECIIPSKIMRDILLTALREASADITSVDLIDPRL